jgi:Zn-dependent protease
LDGFEQENQVTEQQIHYPEDEQCQGLPVAASGQPNSADKPRWKATAGGIGIVAMFLFKFKTVILLVLSKLKFLLGIFKFAKFSKALTTLGSMMVTIAVDAMMWGWKFAVGFVLLIFVHEMGHVLALRAKGINASAPVFIPFVGAFVALKEMPRNARVEAEIAIAGPLLGTLGAVVCFYFGKWANLPLFIRLAYVGFFINLINLLPVLPLDGGRIMAAISPKVWLVGMILTVVGFFVTGSPILLILVLLSLGRMWQAIKPKPRDQIDEQVQIAQQDQTDQIDQEEQESQDYYNVPRLVRMKMTAAYFGLAMFLGVMMMKLHHP